MERKELSRNPEDKSLNPEDASYEILQEKYKEAVLQNVIDLDEKQVLRYETDLLKEYISELEARSIDLNHVYSQLKKNVSFLRHGSAALLTDNQILRQQLSELSEGSRCVSLDESGLLESLLGPEVIQTLMQMPQDSLDAKIRALATDNCQPDLQENPISNAEGTTENETLKEACENARKTLLECLQSNAEPRDSMEFEELQTALDEVIACVQSD